METAEAKIRELLHQTEEAMKSKVEKLKGEFGTLRTGKVNPQILEPVRVEYYGQPVPLKQIAAVSAPDARTLEVRPWDPTALEAIEKALQKADLGTTPQNDGKILRLNLPPLTEDRRKELVKVVRKLAEDYRVSLRSERRDSMEKLKKTEKAGEIAEDEAHKQEGEIQRMTDLYVKKVDELLAAKEHEMLTV